MTPIAWACGRIDIAQRLKRRPEAVATAKLLERSQRRSTDEGARMIDELQKDVGARRIF